MSKLLDNARKEHNTELVMKLIRELKNRGMRNKNKKRGGPIKRLWWIPLIERLGRILDGDLF